uniref:Uncharacterized protein n=1 Tax=Solibacter usitatus (strain Ellin6076) TaxID=234267 RepID=Q02BK3_SOLUE
MPAMEPYLSLVVTARNDDHGGNLLGRMQAFVSGWIEQARRYRIPSELIIVEWNPPAGRPGLIDALQWPDDLGWCEVRFVEVPPEIHARYDHGKALPLYQMIAKNVGIRRARGRFVLATNIDILVSSELAEFLGRQQLDGDRMYRIDRHDAMNEVPMDRPITDQLEYCRTHLIRVNTREGTFNVSRDGRPTLSPNDVASVESGLLFGPGWFAVESHIKGENFRWASEYAEILLPPARDAGSSLMFQIEPGPATGGLPLDLLVEAAGQPIARLEIDRRSWVRLPLAAPLPEKIVLRANTLGAAAELDLRPLCFRVFRMDWEQRLPKGIAAGSLQASVRPAGVGSQLIAAWNAMQHVINRLAHGGPLVPLTVPVSPRLRRTLKAYLEWGGVVGLVVNAVPRVLRKLSRTRLTLPGSEIFPVGSGLMPGTGWRKLNDYRGEGFRDAANGAEIIAVPCDAATAVLAVQVEPVKTMAVRSFEVVLLDEAGRAIAKQAVNGLSYLKFPVQRTPGRSDVFRLAFPDSSPEAFGLRVFWCGWTDAGKSTVTADVLALPWGAGWKRDPIRGTMTSQGAAELILRASPRPLFLDLETDGPAQFEIRDAGGKVLVSFAASGRAVHQLEFAIEGGGLRVLQLSSTAPFRAYGVDWEGAQEAVAAVQDQPSPAFLHTNGCGDFTLLSRERWFDLRAYPEIDVFSMNLDSMFCFAAHYGGAREAVLADPMRIYHIEHGTGSGWTPEGQVKLFERIAAKGIPCVENDEVLAWAKQMRRLKSPLIFNHENWGMADLDLKEESLKGRWRER